MLSIFTLIETMPPEMQYLLHFDVLGAICVSGAIGVIQPTRTGRSQNMQKGSKMIMNGLDDRRETEFGSRIRLLYNFVPDSPIWTSLEDVLSHIRGRAEFRGYPGPNQVLWLRRMCEAAGLTREDRIMAPGHVDTSEGYYGLVLKAEA